MEVIIFKLTPKTYPAKSFSFVHTLD